MMITKSFCMSLIGTSAYAHRHKPKHTHISFQRRWTLGEESSQNNVAQHRSLNVLIAFVDSTWLLILLVPDLSLKATEEQKGVAFISDNNTYQHAKPRWLDGGGRWRACKTPKKAKKKKWTCQKPELFFVVKEFRVNKHSSVSLREASSGKQDGPS